MYGDVSAGLKARSPGLKSGATPRNSRYRVALRPRGECPVRVFLQDVRFALRQCASHPGFALTAILSLALGIGATVSVFSIVYAVLMNPWPYAGADRMYFPTMLDKAGNEADWEGLTGPQIRQLRQAHAIEDVMAFNGWNLTVTGGDVPEDVSGVYLTNSGLQFLGMPAMLGRNFLPSDAPDGQEPQPVVVLGYKFWRRHFNGDPSVVGKSIQLLRKTYTILGVLPQRFTWMDGDVYLPLKVPTPTSTYGALIKLKPGATPAAATAELGPLFQQFAKETPTHFAKQFTFQARSISYRYRHDLGGTLGLLFAAVGLLLAIGCGNVSIDNTYKAIAERVNFYEQLRDKIGTLPDVLSTGISTNATPPNNGWDQPFELMGRPSAEGQQARINFDILGLVFGSAADQ
jgi:putative ABC transport system permease protein